MHDRVKNGVILRNDGPFFVLNMGLAFEKCLILCLVKVTLRHILCLLLMAVALAAVGQQAAVTQITGMVRDSLSHEGIAYASVSLLGTSEGTLATDKGGFTINSRASFKKLRVTAMGYSPKEEDA